MRSEQDIRAYHERTQHHLHRYAKALGYMDWATQPDPFRRYEGAPQIPLPLRVPDGRPRYGELFAGRLPAAPLAAASVGQLFQDSLALSAWKEFSGSRWALRVNPSSGNLHPTEAYLLAAAVPGLFDGPVLCHYQPESHSLELRAQLPPALWRRLTAELPERALLLGLTSIPWRESWKYGERAYRYCMQDLGHALGALAFAAAALGWCITLLPVPDPALAVLLGVDGQSGPEAEHPDALVLVHLRVIASSSPAPALPLGEDLIAALRAIPKAGAPARLSVNHQDWPVIDGAIAATRLLAPPPAPAWDRAAPIAVPPSQAPDHDARALFHQRRSAVAMDGESSIGAASLFATLQRACDPGTPPLQWLPSRSRIHLLLFVHRVDGLVPGLYCLVRGGQEAGWLRARMRHEFLWEPVAGAVSSLFLLLPIDCRDAARTVCCHQEIAADSAFAVAMLAEFAPALDHFGPWGWRLLHWEAGAVGQLLYLEAEANGLRATGIGCFFDSAVHELLGIANDDLRTIYHFTTGGAVDDARLQTAAPYPPRC